MDDQKLGATDTSDQQAPPLDHQRRRAILKALAAAGPVILTVTPFYARAEYVGTQYFVGSVCTKVNKKGEPACDD